MIRIGTSGWSYAGWRGRFYPRDLKQSDWLSYYAGRFDTVELNATTYRLPTEQHVQKWCAAVPPGFLYTVKLSRLITHRKTLPPRVDTFIASYMARIRCFRRARLAQILCQFPPYLTRDDERLASFLDKLPRRYRYVVEFRHKSWLTAAVADILRRRDVAMCIHDYPGCKTGDLITSRHLAYVRLHGYVAPYVGSYPRRTLRRWAQRVRGLAEQADSVFVYFNNDVDAAAVRDAACLRELLA
ncbi:MAG: DUF72 domain-containing protein [Candidatus Eremiobacteraeota bacterium]|nr:DUF72 domain-containing protein [Candidatus Eremiobacteraeota bacterium]MBC5827951.1 DUF72 domain-containing protein [Candidatus Eremiobacteraeota bacterium]